MNDEKKDSKTEKPKSTPTTTLGDAAQLVPAKHLEAEKELHTATLDRLKRVEAELAAEKSIVAARDLVLKEKERLLIEAENTRNLAVQETCKEKSKQVVSAKLIESLKAEIEKLKLDVLKQRDRAKTAMSRAVEYRRETSKLAARLFSAGIPLEPLSEEPVFDEEDDVAEGVTP